MLCLCSVCALSVLCLCSVHPNECGFRFTRKNTPNIGEQSQGSGKGPRKGTEGDEADIISCVRNDGICDSMRHDMYAAVFDAVWRLFLAFKEFASCLSQTFRPPELYIVTCIMLECINGLCLWYSTSYGTAVVLILLLLEVDRATARCTYST